MISLFLLAPDMGVLIIIVQWNLSIKDKLEPGNLSTVERLSTLQR